MRIRRRQLKSRERERKRERERERGMRGDESTHSRQWMYNVSLLGKSACGLKHILRKAIM